MLQFKNNTNGFTLIELLVVIMIIGILATVATVMLSATRPKARDMKRISDVKQIQTALHLYFANQGTYPDEVIPGGSITDPDTGTIYLAEVPIMPTTFNNNSCNDVTGYEYRPSDNYRGFELDYCLDNNVDWVPEGKNTADQNTISTPFICGLPLQYGGQSYNTVLIGHQCWMQENLNIGTKLADINTLPSNDNAIEKWCHTAFSSGDCNMSGGLYNWNEAMNLPNSCNTTDCSSSINAVHQGACPSSWHIPTRAEWHELELVYANPQSDCDIDRVSLITGCPPYTMYGCPSAADELKGLESESGFNSIFYGFRRAKTVDANDFIYDCANASAKYWLADPTLENPDIKSWASGLSYYPGDCIELSKTTKIYYSSSIRCLKD